MNTPIKTNQLVADINYEKLDERYDIFRVTTDKNYFPRGAYILDVPQLNDNIRSVYFESGKSFYILMPSSVKNLEILKEVLLNTDEGDSITITAESSSSLDKRVVVSLLLNALGTFENEALKYSNLTGHLYVFRTDWKSKDHRDEQLIALEIAVKDEMRLAINVRTFSSEELKDKIIFRKGKKFENYPQYVIGKNFTMKRALKGDTGKRYILRQVFNEKVSVEGMVFLNNYKLPAYENSKMGVLQQTVEYANRKYNGICSLSFAEIEGYQTVGKPRSALKKLKEKTIVDFFSDKTIRIIDYIGTEQSEKFDDALVSELKNWKPKQFKKTNFAGITASCGKRPSAKGVNIGVVYPKEHYLGIDDPYTNVGKDITMQHITMDDKRKWKISDIRSSIPVMLTELIIKSDIKNRRITMFDWTTLGLEHDVSFGLKAEVDNVERYFFLSVHPDGAIEFSEEKLDSLFTLSEYTECAEIFNLHKDVAGVIRYDDGCINLIRDTNWFTIPELDQIKNELKSGNSALRNSAKRDELMPGIIDIKMFEWDNGTYYFAGEVGSGLDEDIRNAINIRKIEGYRGSEIRFQELLALMNVFFVRNNRLTVFPFPFKYLREYIAMVENKTI